MLHLLFSASAACGSAMERFFVISVVAAATFSFSREFLFSRPPSPNFGTSIAAVAVAQCHTGNSIKLHYILCQYVTLHQFIGWLQSIQIEFKQNFVYIYVGSLFWHSCLKYLCALFWLKFAMFVLKMKIVCKYNYRRLKMVLRSTIV